MDWFKRYGITGSYFLVFLIAWLYALFPSMFNRMEHNIFSFIAAAFLPVGYLITIFQQSIYLNKKLKKKKRGIHLWAKIDTEYSFPDEENLIDYWRVFQEDWSEAAIEVLSTFSIVEDVIKQKINLNFQKHFQDWHRRRMDVLVISSSMLCATIIVLISVSCIFGLYCFTHKSLPESINKHLLSFLLIISIFIICVLSRNIRLISNQIRFFLSLIFHRYKQPDIRKK